MAFEMHTWQHFFEGFGVQSLGYLNYHSITSPTNLAFLHLIITRIAKIESILYHQERSLNSVFFQKYSHS